MSSSFIRFTCPNCNRGLKAAEEKAGTVIACPQCREQFRVPARPAPEPPPLEAALADDADQGGRLPPPPADGPPPSPNQPGAAREGKGERNPAAGWEAAFRSWVARVPVWGWVVGGVAGFLILSCAGVWVLVHAGSNPRHLIVGEWRGLLLSGQYGTWAFYSDGLMEDMPSSFEDRRMKYRFVDNHTIELTPADIDPEAVRAIGPPPSIRLQVSFPSADEMEITIDGHPHRLMRVK